MVLKIVELYLFEEGDLVKYDLTRSETSVLISIIFLKIKQQRTVKTFFNPKLIKFFNIYKKNLLILQTTLKMLSTD